MDVTITYIDQTKNGETVMIRWPHNLDYLYKN